MSANEADRRTDDDDDESTHLLPRSDVTVTTRDVTASPCDVDSEGRQPSVAGGGGGGGGGGGIIPSRRRSSLTSHGRHSLSRPVNRRSVDGIAVCVDDDGGGRASLLAHGSPGGYGTLCPSPVHAHHHQHQKLSRLRRLSFAEVVERITLTWENVDVYAPPTSSTPLLLSAGLGASAASAATAQPKHILKNGTKHPHHD